MRSSSTGDRSDCDKERGGKSRPVHSEGESQKSPSSSSFIKKAELDSILLSFKTFKLDSYLKKLRSSENLDVMQILGKQILERADHVRKMIAPSRIRQEMSRRHVMRGAERMTKETLSKVFPARKKRETGTEEEPSTQNES